MRGDRRTERSREIRKRDTKARERERKYASFSIIFYIFESAYKREARARARVCVFLRTGDGMRGSPTTLAVFSGERARFKRATAAAAAAAVKIETNAL